MNKECDLVDAPWADVLLTMMSKLSGVVSAKDFALFFLVWNVWYAPLSTLRNVKRGAVAVLLRNVV